jgi:hypothetical protein
MRYRFVDFKLRRQGTKVHLEPKVYNVLVGEIDPTTAEVKQALMTG